MSQYTKATNFTAKDGLPAGNSGKVVKGAELDTEFTAIASAISSKADSNSPTLTGTPLAPTASAATNNTQIATTAYADTAVSNERTATATLTNKTLTSPTINGGTLASNTITSPTISGGTITGITDLAVADGGTGSSSLAANSVLLGNGTSALQVVAPGSNGNVLTSNGTTWTSASIPNPSSATVGNAYAGLSFGDVGTYALLSATSASTTISRGSTYAGSGFTFLGYWSGSAGGGAALISAIGGGTPSGTWRAMCENGNSAGSYYNSGLFLRIS